MPRVTYKVTEFNPDVLTRSMFENKRSYDHFLIGLKAAIQIQQLKDSGNIILENGEMIDSRYDFHIAFDMDTSESELTMPRLGPHHNGGLVMWIGYTMGTIPRTVFVYKKELDIFKKITYIDPSHQHKFKLQS